MFSKVIYNRKNHVMVVDSYSLQKTYKLQPFDMKDTPKLKFDSSCINFIDYSSVLALCLENCEEIQESLQTELHASLDPETIGVLKMFESARVYFSDGMIWDWNFEFIIDEE